MHLQSLTKKIHKHCPELLELSFGCKTSRGTITSVFQSEGTYGYAMQPYSTRWEGGNGSASARMYTADEFEILGHPIELPHVLRAIEKSVSDRPSWQEVRMTIGGCIYLVDSRTGDTYSKELWDLTKPLSGQSEECLKFLDEIIK